MPDLLKLAEQCEKRTGPDRELDLAIYLALWPTSNLARTTEYPRGLNGQEGYSWDIRGASVIYERWTDDGRCPVNGGYPLPAYTASIDAAMTLKADDVDIDLAYSIILIDGKAWFAELTAGDPHQTGFWPQQGRGVNAALAICAAALRALPRADLRE